MMVPLHYQCCKLLPVRIITINRTRYSSQLFTCWFRMYSYSNLILQLQLQAKQTLYVLSNFMSRMIATRSPVTWLFTSWLCSSEYGIFPPVHSSHSTIPAARVMTHATSQSNYHYRATATVLIVASYGTWHQPRHTSRDKCPGLPLLFILQVTKAGRGGLGTRLATHYSFLLSPVANDNVPAVLLYRKYQHICSSSGYDSHSNVTVNFFNLTTTSCLQWQLVRNKTASPL